MQKISFNFSLKLLLALAAFSPYLLQAQTSSRVEPTKPVVYQVFTRLYGNKVTTNKPWGTKEENGVGKFNDINAAALQDMRALGVTHVWYTGVLHHALIGDYSALGIAADDPDVVKGRAGSPYAIKDYYNLNPDLAVNPAKRMEEFEALIQRTHAQGLKVIIDIVPNHVARRYHSLQKPHGVEDFGATDNTSVDYHRDNNFYYVVGQPFKVPDTPGYKPLGGENHALSDGQFLENPAKWTGNGSRKPQPQADDWYETVKINYGIKPDGTKDFPLLPEEFKQKSTHEHYVYWQGKSVPSSWKKFRQIAEFWQSKGVDGFRFDMAEMVPVEFWSYLNSAIKEKNPQAFLMAEVYTPSEYRNYIQLGRMDYLYDKVGLYDTLKAIMQAKAKPIAIATAQDAVSDIESHMLHFLENHDEQRIASPEFAGAAEKAMPAMVVSALIGRSPTMIYFGQEVGESGALDAGFGKASRTTIFDYWGVPAHQRWMNRGKFDGALSSSFEKSLHSFYVEILNLSKQPAFIGPYQSDLGVSGQDADMIFAFSRGDQEKGRVIVVSNFSAVKMFKGQIQLPASLVTSWRLPAGDIELDKQFPLAASYTQGTTHTALHVQDNEARFALDLPPLASIVLRVK